MWFLTLCPIIVYECLEIFVGKCKILFIDLIVWRYDEKVGYRWSR